MDELGRVELSIYQTGVLHVNFETYFDWLSERQANISIYYKVLIKYRFIIWIYSLVTSADYCEYRIYISKMQDHEKQDHENNVPSRLLPQWLCALWQLMHLGTCTVHVLKCMSCHKAMVVITRGHIVSMIAYR